MRRRLGLTLLGLCGILGLTIAIGAALVGREEYIGFIDHSIRTEAAKHGVRLTIRNLGLVAIGLQASEVDTFIVRHLLSLTVGEAVVKITSPTPTVAFSGKLYGGELEGTVTKRWFSDRLEGSAEVTEVSLTRHPQLSALGVSGGTVSGRCADLVADLSSSKVERAHFNITVTSFSRATPLTIPAGRFGAPLGFTIPPIPPTDITVEGAFQNQRVAVRKLVVETELGTVAASGMVPVDGQGELAVDALVSLSPTGSSRLGAFLPVVSNGAVPADTSKVRVVIHGTIRKPAIRWSRAG